MGSPFWDRGERSAVECGPSRARDAAPCMFWQPRHPARSGAGPVALRPRLPTGLPLNKTGLRHNRRAEAFTLTSNRPFRLTRPGRPIAGIEACRCDGLDFVGRVQLTEILARAQNVVALRQCLRIASGHTPTADRKNSAGEIFSACATRELIDTVCCRLRRAHVA
jgi:hypothetical protein